MNKRNPLWVGLFWVLGGWMGSAQAELPPASLPAPSNPAAIAHSLDGEAIPTPEWMQQTLSDLAERYHCAGNTAYQRLQGEQTATRYEIAALLFSCSEALALPALNPEDRNALQRLQTTLRSELATLQGVGGGNSPALELVPQTLDLRSVPLEGEPQTWSAGFGIRDVLVSKARLTLTAQWSGKGSLNPSTEISYGAFYQFPLRDRLVLSPSVIILTHPTESRTPTFQGAVQASFSF